MSKICNFPISETRRCRQRIADDEPNCGRHICKISADQLGQNPVIYKKDNRLHIWAGEPDDLYCLIHKDSGEHALYQMAGEVPPNCLVKAVNWVDKSWRRHRDGAPAVIWPDGSEEWWQHGELHRDDGPAIVRADGTQEWYQHGEPHRDGGPAKIKANGRQEWWRHGMRV